MATPNDTVRIRWDEDAKDAVAAAVAAQEAAGLLPAGTSQEMANGSLALGKTEAATIIAHDRSFACRTLDDGSIRIMRPDWGDDPPSFEIKGVPERKSEASPERSREFHAAIAGSAFREG